MEFEGAYVLLAWLYENGDITEEDVNKGIAALKEEFEGMVRDGSWTRVELDDMIYNLDKIQNILTR